MSIQPATGAKEKRLAALLEEKGRDASDSALATVVEDAQLLGSLELAGVRASWAEVRASRAAGEGPARGPRAAPRPAAVPAGAPLTVGAVRAWHAALLGPVGFRTADRVREGEAPRRRRRS